MIKLLIWIQTGYLPPREFFHHSAKITLTTLGHNVCFLTSTNLSMEDQQQFMNESFSLLLLIILYYLQYDNQDVKYLWWNARIYAKIDTFKRKTIYHATNLYNYNGINIILMKILFCKKHLEEIFVNQENWHRFIAEFFDIKCFFLGIFDQEIFPVLSSGTEIHLIKVSLQNI